MLNTFCVYKRLACFSTAYGVLKTGVLMSLAFQGRIKSKPKLNKAQFLVDKAIEE
jgi:hypothetical protein